MLKSQCETESIRISEAHKLDLQDHEDRLRILSNELETIKEKNWLLEEKQQRLFEKLVQQERKITILETNTIDLAKYEKLIHGSMQKREFALYNDIYLETFRGLLPVAESLENLSNQILASNNPNLEALKLLKELKDTQLEQAKALSNGQEIMKEVLSNNSSNLQPIDESENEISHKILINPEVKEDNHYNCSETQDIVDGFNYFHNKTLILDPFDETQNISDSFTSKNIIEEIKKKIDEDLYILRGFASQTFNKAKESMGRMSGKLAAKSQVISEKINVAGNAIRSKSGKMAQKGMDIALQAGRRIEVVTNIAFDAAQENLGKVSENLAKHAEEVAKNVKEVLESHSEKIIETSLDIAGKTSEKVEKIKKAFGKLFG